MSLVIYLPQDAWNVKESLALLASTAATNTTATSQTSVTTSNSASARFVPGELTVRLVSVWWVEWWNFVKYQIFS